MLNPAKHRVAPKPRTRPEFLLRLVPFIRAALLSFLATGLRAHADCTAGSPNIDVVAATPTSEFTVHGNGTVTHGKTGLMWKQCAEGMTTTTTACDTGSASTMTWSTALSTAEGSTFAGYNDWRLPNHKELQSIVEICGFNPAINQTVFPNTPTSYNSPTSFFWSASTLAPFPAGAWDVEFYGGDSSAHNKTLPFYVRLVRGGQFVDTVDTALDYVPDAFSFAPVTNASLSTVYVSNTISVTGITDTTSISIAGGEYRINNSAFTSDPGLVAVGDIVDVRQTSSGSNSTVTIATLTIGGVSGAFNVTTKGAPVADLRLPLPTGPNSFPGSCGVLGSTAVSSNPAYTRPLGELITGGNFHLTLELGALAGPIDVYIVVELPNGQKLMLNSARQWVAFPPAAPFLANIQNPVAMTDVFDNLYKASLASIPKGAYKAWLVMVPAGTNPATFDLAKSSYYLWCFGKSF